MKARFKFNHWLPRLVGAGAITLYPYVLCSQSAPEARRTKTIAHEMVHVLQVRKLGFFTMYWRYIVEFMKLRFQGVSHWDAHAMHSMEREAVDASIRDTAALNALYELEHA